MRYPVSFLIGPLHFEILYEIAFWPWSSYCTCSSHMHTSVWKYRDLEIWTKIELVESWVWIGQVTVLMGLVPVQIRHPYQYRSIKSYLTASAHSQGKKDGPQRDLKLKNTLSSVTLGFQKSLPLHQQQTKPEDAPDRSSGTWIRTIVKASWCLITTFSWCLSFRVIEFISMFILTCMLQDLEAKLGTDLPSVGASILLAVGIVLVNFGIEGLLDIWLGESLRGDVWCMVMVSNLSTHLCNLCPTNSLTTSVPCI